MTFSEYILRGRDQITAAHLECADPLLHMKQIVEAALGISTAALYLNWDNEIGPVEIQAVDTFLKRRLTGEPFQYILGYEWFWNDRFSVGPGVLIPRRETEILIEYLLKTETREEVTIAELGAGTGNIGITALKEKPPWKWFGFEKSSDAFAYLSENISQLLTGKNFRAFNEDFFSAAHDHAPYDWIVSNPPYVPSEDFPTLSREVKSEPALALDGGRAGLEVYERLIPTCAQLLASEGRILFEMEHRQGAAINRMLLKSGFSNIEILKDYSGLDRAITARGIRK